MSAPETDSMSIASLPLVAGGRHAHRPSELELEVMALFDAYRARLLGYVSAFGLTGHDGEEVVQEVFLSLFCHLRMGKSRSNLRGWVFRVAHNLALKQRMANRRWLDRVETERDMECLQISGRGGCWRWLRRCRSRIGFASACGLRDCATARLRKF
jgi:DNA-directed RNA polymerase specialized sigma24 family protein